ncbi:MAG: hypothetical protein M3Z97_06195 [Candidatus Dormibacteraeota bacterium]|nr:hypothetical protein [Candidatus Dormibacteraeota bacterium]
MDYLTGWIAAALLMAAGVAAIAEPSARYAGGAYLGHGNLVLNASGSRSSSRGSPGTCAYRTAIGI